MITVIGSINMDLVVTTERAPEAGETVLGNSFRQILGGKGANQAVAAARCGAHTTMVGRVGTDSFGDDILRGLQRDLTDVSMIQRIDNTPSGIASILVDGKGQNRITVVSGANYSFTTSDINALRPLIASSQVLLVQLEIPLNIVYQSLEIAHEEGVFTILNPAPAVNLPMEIYRTIDLLTPNESELSLLTGMPTSTRPQWIDAAHELHRRGVRALLVTLGSEGSLYMNNSGDMKHVPAYRVRAVDTTAAGDCFNGALACEIDRLIAESGEQTRHFSPTADQMAMAIDFATRASAISVTRVGAQPSLPYRHEIEAFDEWYKNQPTSV